MAKVKFEESTISLENGGTGKVAVFMYSGQEDPVVKLDQAVSSYVGYKSHMQFVDINMDNPWIRVVIIGVNEMKQADFDPTIHKA